MSGLPVQGRLMDVGQEQLTSDDYYTPESVFDALALRFDIDVCAPPGGVPWVPADRYYSMAEDGLSQPWEGRVWMNPPYSQATPWVRRFIEHGHGVCLVPHARAQWHRDLWDSADALAHPGRFYFHARREIFMPVVFAAFGEECVEALERVGTVRSLRSARFASVSHPGSDARAVTSGDTGAPDASHAEVGQASGGSGGVTPGDESS